MQPHPDVPQSLTGRARLLAAAWDAGHRVAMGRNGRLLAWCSCGWKYGAKGSLRQQISAVTDHVVRAGLTALGVTPEAGEIPPYTGPIPAFRDWAYPPEKLGAAPIDRRVARNSSDHSAVIQPEV